jgi:molybdate transport system substrate-binding protein
MLPKRALITIALLSALSLLPACKAQSMDITVLAAASLTDAFNQMAEEFEAVHSDVQVLASYGSSSELALQLSEGAAADVFASANDAQMKVAVDAGRISGEPVTFLTNQLVIIVPADNPANIQSPGDLAKDGVVLLLAAPGVPVREYSDRSIALMGDADFQTAVYANLASEEPNVRQVASKIARGKVMRASCILPTSRRILQNWY